MITMTFPVEMFQTVLDLRGIPLILGSFYGGVYTALLLFGSLVAYRQILGGIDLWHYTAALLPTAAIVLASARAFARANAKKRMLMAFGVCLFLRATVVNLYFLLEGRQHFGKSKFKQAVINIGKNAIEAMPDGGKLVLH